MSTQTPYVGPRSFKESEDHLFYGRDIEIRRLVQLVKNNQTVVVFARSGAGKSSLLNVALLNRLDLNEVVVAPGVRVTDPENSAFAETAAPTAASEAETPADSITGFEINAARNAGLAFNWGIDNWKSRPSLWTLLDSFDSRSDQSLLLILDQFEELFTQPVADWRERKTFLRRLARLLDERPQLRLVISIREEWLADINDRARLFPDGLRAKMRLAGLERKQAVEAIRCPSERFGRAGRFTEEAARALADDLAASKTGSHEVDPVQLQVICLAKWKEKRDSGEQITPEDIGSQNAVDFALESYFNECVESIVKSGTRDEISLRDWIGTHLITPSGARGFALVDESFTFPADPATIETLEAWHIVKREHRRGQKWAELTHDRLIEPIKNANERRRRVIAPHAVQEHASTLARLQAVGSVRVGVNLCPPYCYKDPVSGRLTGEGVLLAQWVFRDLGVRHVDFIFSKYDDFFADLDDGKFDVVSCGVYEREEFNHDYRFSRPTHRERHGLVARKDNPCEIKSFADIANESWVVMGITGGGIQGRIAQEYGVDPSRIREYENGWHGGRALRDGHIHVFAINSLFVPWIVEAYGSDKLKPVDDFKDPSVENPKYALNGAMMFRKTDEDLAKKADEAIARIVLTNQYAEQVEKFGIDRAMLPEK